MRHRKWLDGWSWGQPEGQANPTYLCAPKGFGKGLDIGRLSLYGGGMMRTKRVPIRVDVDEGLAGRLDRWRDGLVVPASRPAAVRVLMDIGLSVVEAEKRDGSAGG